MTTSHLSRTLSLVAVACVAALPLRADEASAPNAEPLILQLTAHFGATELKQEIAVVEDGPFRVVTEGERVHWTVEGKVGRVADGVVPVELSISAVAKLGGSVSGTQPLQLKIDEFSAGGGGIGNMAIVDVWVRRGADPIAPVVRQLERGGQGFSSAAIYLSRLGPAAKPAVPQLIEALKGENFKFSDYDQETLHGAAADCLSRIGPAAKDAVPVLLTTRDSPNAYVRLSGAVALWMIARHPAGAETLAALLQDKDRWVRWRTVEALRGMGIEGPDVEAALVEALTREQGSLQLDVAEVLWQTSRHNEAFRTLVKALRAPDDKLRVHACYALSRFGPSAKQSVDALALAVFDEQLQVRNSAVAALHKIDPAGSLSTEKLIQALREEPHEYRRQNAAQALGENLGPSGVLALAEAASREDRLVRSAAYSALYYIGADAAGALADILQHGDAADRKQAAWSLRDIGQKAIPAIPELIEALSDPDLDVRAGAMFALANIGDAAVPALTKALHDKRADVREQAAGALEEMKAQGTLRNVK